MNREAATGEASPVLEEPRAGFDVDEIQRLVQRFFKVYEVEREIRGVPMGEMAAYYIQTDAPTFNEKFDALREAVRAHDATLLVILQHRLGEDVIIVARKPPTTERGPGLNVLLFVLTLITTTLGGALFYQSYSNTEDLLTIRGVDASFLHPRMLVPGLATFSLPLLLILGVHELGHYFVARRHRVRTSLPYFIPVPPIVPIGTFGAFISMREPIPDRKALFDIGASGPVIGFLLAIPVVILGMVLTAAYAVPVPPDDEAHVQLATPVEGLLLGYGIDGAPGPEGNNTTLAFGHALYTATSEKVKDKKFYEERIVVLATNGTLPSGTWRLVVVPLHLRSEQRMDTTVRFLPAPAEAPPAGFVLEENASVARSEIRVNESLNPAVVVFELPGGAERLEASFRWQVPPSGFVKLGDSLLFLGLQWAVDRVYPVDDNVLTHPTGLAGWVGLLVTGFNLLPAGQLDGGHVARAVFGDRMRWASYASVALMLLLAYKFFGWILMAILIVFLGLRHPPPLNDKSPLDPKRRALAALVFLLLVVTFVPYPFVEA